jgi:hypothetical protein
VYYDKSYFPLVFSSIENQVNIDDEIDQVSYKHIKDALALKGDERRGTLR